MTPSNFMSRLRGGVGAREEVVEEAHEDDHVLREDLGDVEVAQGAEEHVGLDLALLGAQEGPGDHQHALDGAEAPVVVLLGGEEVLEQVVQRGKLLGEHLGLDEALRHQHVLHDELPVGDHDRDGAEQRLERLRELRAADVAGVHGDEGAGALLEGQSRRRRRPRRSSARRGGACCPPCRCSRGRGRAAWSCASASRTRTCTARCTRSAPRGPGG